MQAAVKRRKQFFGDGSRMGGNLQMKSTAKLRVLGSVLQQRCPRCQAGSIFRYSIFRGFPKMHDRCTICDLKFEREEGYFLGAMYISYGLALVTILLLAVLLWLATGWSVERIALWATLLFLPFAPTISLFARVLWIYLDQTIDPERPEG
jgi:uncharacterized protein (DUF983 family)